ncbi:hypothetical protein T484DRAFT_1803331 [Baffinella frigidus]|nr:hypothetical protein T484DRAFT_1803331 [Cryptophyta sp. CCMP2293]
MSGEAEGGGGGGGGGNAKLYIGNLAFQTRSEDLFDYFGQFGKIEDATVIMEREDPGRSRGFGFVTYVSSSDADHAIGKADGVEWMDGVERMGIPTHPL